MGWVLVCSNRYERRRVVGRKGESPAQALARSLSSLDNEWSPAISDMERTILLTRAAADPGSFRFKRDTAHPDRDGSWVDYWFEEDGR